ncbi:MAG: acyl-CoA dehydrogenase family protein [Dehalococcoidia bacterium]
MSGGRFIELLTPAELHLIETVRDVSSAFAANVPMHDHEATVAFEHLDALRRCGYLAAAVPAEHGGSGASLLAIVLAQAALAESDPSTALGVGMHLMVTGGESWVPSWEPDRRRAMYAGVVAGRIFLNVLATEPEMGSPQGGTRPATLLTPVGAGRWLLSGRKTFATFAHALTHALVFASVEDGSGDVAMAIVPMDTDGITIECTWDTIGMRGTASHDVYFSEVPLSDGDLLTRRPAAFTATRPAMSPWFVLTVAASYLGIARAARDEAVSFARQRRPGGGPAISTVPYVRDQIARMDLHLFACESILVMAALSAGQDLVRAPRVRPIEPLEAAAKLEVGDRACEVVDLAMRVMGGAGLQRMGRLERLYRDVRSATVHPPIEARALDILARSALDDPTYLTGMMGSALLRPASVS